MNAFILTGGIRSIDHLGVPPIHTGHPQAIGVGLSAILPR